MLEIIEVDLDGNINTPETYGVYVCPRCNDGYYKDDDGSCNLCAYSEELQEAESDSCLECLTKYRCTKCPPELIITYLEDGCQYPIDNCAATPENYLNDGIYHVCPECAFGFFASLNKCVPCTIDGCADCSAEDFCQVCEEGKWMTDDHQYCYDPIDYCRGPEFVKVLINEDDETEFICTNCSISKAWDSTSSSCEDCEDVIENCIDCDHDVCLTCSPGFHHTPDKKACEENFDHCLVDDAIIPIPFAYALDEDKNSYWCSTCEDGYVWNEEERACQECSEIDPDCLTCELSQDSYNSICTSCDGGKIPTPNGLFCTDRLDHCLDAPLADQPEGLTPLDELFWSCENCSQNYYFDGLICTHCGINNCFDCKDSLTCTLCAPEYNLFEGDCYPWIRHCKIDQID